MAPYCAIPRDYLSDTLLLRAMGFLVSQHGQLGAIPRPPFLSISPLESMQSGGAIPPPQKGYLGDTCAIPYENKANGCDTPPSAIRSRKGIARYGGVSRTGPLRGWGSEFGGYKYKIWVGFGRDLAANKNKNGDLWKEHILKTTKMGIQLSVLFAFADMCGFYTLAAQPPQTMLHVGVPVGLLQGSFGPFGPKVANRVGK